MADMAKSTNILFIGGTSSGKTVAASMIAAFFEKGFDSRKIFGGLDLI